ncbi:MAG TPA: low temperature requirement protein A, partial [Candidatus Obscuribacterales bacterium]
MTKALWQPPRLRRDDEQAAERHATWLELFYDLVFVAAIAELAHLLSQNISWDGFLGFVVLFVPIWWCWVGAAFYATRFDTGGIVDRLFALVQMAIVAAMAVNVHHGLNSAGSGFAICYVLFRSTLILQYLNAGYHLSVARSLARWYATGFGLSAGLWLISAFVPPPWRLGLWLVGLVIDFSTPFSAGRLVAKIPPSMSHIPERIGLFTLIVLGE